MDLFLGFLRQAGDLGGLRWGPLYRVEAVQRREEPQPVGGAYGLFQVTHLVQELLDGVVALYRAAFNHLHKGGGAIKISASSLCTPTEVIYPHVIVTVAASSSTSPN